MKSDAQREEDADLLNAWREPFDFLGYTFGRMLLPAEAAGVYLGRSRRRSASSGSAARSASSSDRRHAQVDTEGDRGR